LVDESSKNAPHTVSTVAVRENEPDDRAPIQVGPIEVNRDARTAHEEEAEPTEADEAHPKESDTQTDETVGSESPLDGKATERRDRKRTHVPRTKAQPPVKVLPKEHEKHAQRIEPDGFGASSGRGQDVRRPPDPWIARAESTGKRSNKQTGFLNVGAKPWAQFDIDNKPWPFQTPQAAIELSVGKHTITLRNAETGVTRSQSFQIVQGQYRTISVDMTKK
jgi:hypothetical protein